MQQNGYILILAIGMVIVIISGHIDLSVGSIAGFVGAMSAVLMIKHAMPWPLAVVLCLLLGASIGAWQGFWIAYVGIPSFIVTLAGMLVFRGATQYLLEGQSIAPFPRSFSQVSSGFLPEIGGSGGLYHWPTVILGLLVMVGRGLAAGAAAKDAVPLRLRRLAAGLVRVQVRGHRRRAGRLHPAVGQLPRRARGRHHPGRRIRHLRVRHAQHRLRRQVYAVGGNEAAARLSGVKNKRVTFLVFVNMGLLSALAGLLFAARLNSATPQAGIGMELEAIAAAFIGGASASGGVGTVLGAIIGGFVLGVLNNGMSLIGIGSDVQQVIKGLVLLAAVGFDIYNKKKGGS